MSKYAAPTPPMIAARWKGGPQVPKVVVMHCTVSSCIPGAARAIARFFATENNKTSAHYVRDPHETIQSVPDHVVAYHCGHNQDSIGYELCDLQAGPDSRWSDKNHEDMLLGAAKDVAQLCLAYGIPIVRLSVADLKAGKGGICGHVDESNAFHGSTHTDPGPGFPWAHFMGLVRAAANALQAPTSGVSQRDVVPPVKATHAPNIDAADASLAKAGKVSQGAKAKAIAAARKLLAPFRSTGKA